MSRGQRVAEAIERSVSGPMWHGPALADLIGDVSAEHAADHPVGGAHSIWELVLHVTAWTEIVRERLGSPGFTGEPTTEIGRASCRERSVDLGGRRIIKKKKRRHCEDGVS